MIAIRNPRAYISKLQGLEMHWRGVKVCEHIHMQSVHEPVLDGYKVCKTCFDLYSFWTLTLFYSVPKRELLIKMVHLKFRAAYYMQGESTQNL